MLTTYRLVMIRDRGVGPATESAIQESWLTKLGGFGVQGSGVARQDSSHKDCIDKVLKKRHDSCNKKRLFLGTFRLFSPHSVSCSQPVVNLWQPVRSFPLCSQPAICHKPPNKLPSSCTLIYLTSIQDLNLILSNLSFWLLRLLIHYLKDL